ncbi:MAG TPA: sigma-70 family RNA polymerase sigma factor, partial [Solirubrobacteraceae bacterium]|nr:sigma-70 family RNA polymerase sigma factor [Solirubrobacteraceae bacterium]
MSALAVATGPADRETDDLDLVAAVRAGDDRAFEVLYRRYQPRIATYVGGMLRDHGRAEDITQEVFMSALRRLRTDDEREILFRPWIYEIAKNKCIDAYRRGRNTNEVSLDAHDPGGVAERDRLAEPSATPDAAVEGKVAFDHLRGAFGGLSAVHHDILVMREFEGLSYREIGERLGMTRPAVESTLFRARKRLGEEYDELVSGKRCLRVQRVVEEGGLRAAGIRDQRRVARHLAHCQPCRRHAHRAGADIDLPRRAPSRVAALLPLPAFVRRRWGGGDDAAQFLSVQASRPAAQMTAQLAGTVDPGMASGWARLAATAATVALAGVGGATIEHRASERPASERGGSGQAAEPSPAAPASAQT